MTNSPPDGTDGMHRLKAGDKIVVRLPPDVAGWVRPHGSQWRGVVVFVSGDSVDVIDCDGVVEPVDREYVEIDSAALPAGHGEQNASHSTHATIDTTTGR